MRSRHFQTELLNEFDGEDASDGARWIVSYADFITLMFAFFVVMYSISSVNDGKFRVLSQTMLNVFQNPEVAAAVEQRLLERAQQQSQATPAELDGSDALEIDTLADPGSLDPAELGEVLATLLSAPIAEQGVRVRNSNDWTEIELGSTFTFHADSMELTPAAAAAVAQIAELARAVDVQVRVEGFTDNVPLGVGPYASNLERSAAFAASIADALATGGVDSGRVSAAGFGAEHPLVSNASAAGRERNRRVVVALARHDRVTPAAVSMAARAAMPEQLPSRTLTRVTELPGPESLTP